MGVVFITLDWIFCFDDYSYHDTLQAHLRRNWPFSAITKLLTYVTNVDQ